MRQRSRSTSAAKKSARTTTKKATEGASPLVAARDRWVAAREKFHARRWNELVALAHLDDDDGRGLDVAAVIGGGIEDMLAELADTLSMLLTFTPAVVRAVEVAAARRHEKKRGQGADKVLARRVRYTPEHEEMIAALAEYRAARRGYVQSFKVDSRGELERHMPGVRAHLAAAKRRRVRP